MIDLKSYIRSIPDFPKPGVMFRDVTPLFGNGVALRAAVDALGDAFSGEGVQAVAGIESRGFVLAGALAYRKGVPFIPIRKAGKLPHKTRRAEYTLEYGQGVLEAHVDAVEPGQRVLLIDDLVATGGTAAASVELIRALGGAVVGAGFLIELAFLPWRERLEGVRCVSLISYADENP